MNSIVGNLAGWRKATSANARCSHLFVVAHSDKFSSDAAAAAAAISESSNQVAASTADGATHGWEIEFASAAASVLLPVLSPIQLQMLHCRVGSGGVDGDSCNPDDNAAYAGCCCCCLTRWPR